MKLLTNLLVIFALAFFMVIVCSQGIQLNEVQKELAKVQAQNFETQQQLQETEARCERMTDTCIDIIANRRWEE